MILLSMNINIMYIRYSLLKKCNNCLHDKTHLLIQVPFEDSGDRRSEVFCYGSFR